jgi:4-hydroxy-2-oxoheptanedioate aldolase
MMLNRKYLVEASRIKYLRSRRLRIAFLGIALLVMGIIAPTGTLSAQEPVKHLNPVIEKLAAGKPFIGFQTGDLSFQNARTMARAEADYVYVEMEHAPMDFGALHQFSLGMIDKATVLKKGNAQPNMALFARFAPYGREQAQWVAKQALDIGLMGVIFNGIDNAEQALLAVRNMRYPQKRTSKYQNPPGLRGWSPTLAVWSWGISSEEYERRADVWPLNPDGDLLAIMMVETTEGLKNVDAIAAVPGVGAIFVGAGSDLRQSLGVESNSPEVEQAFQTILKACLAHNVACGITALSAQAIARRLAEGWKMIRTTNGALTQWRASAPARP